MQKTAYEVRISDWSSDVCSSDLCSSVAGVNSSFIVLLGALSSCEKAIPLPNPLPRRTPQRAEVLPLRYTTQPNALASIRRKRVRMSGFRAANSSSDPSKNSYAFPDYGLSGAIKIGRAHV